MIDRTKCSGIVFAAAIAFSASCASAHTDGGVAHGIWQGLQHPVSGWDHLVAMVAVGLWGAFLGQRAMLLLPVVFPAVMAAGAALAMVGFPIPSVEVWIPISAIVLGLAVALAFKPPFYVAALIVGSFAIFHGYAHGAEIPTATNPLAYALGFVSATVLLHWAGIGLGLLTFWETGRVAVRTTGVAIAVMGIVFLGKSFGT